MLDIKLRRNIERYLSYGIIGRIIFLLAAIAILGVSFVEFDTFIGGETIVINTMILLMFIYFIYTHVLGRIFSYINSINHIYLFGFLACIFYYTGTTLIAVYPVVVYSNKGFWFLPLAAVFICIAFLFDILDSFLESKKLFGV